MDPVIESYERSQEEKRLTEAPVRRIEFLTAVRILEEHLPSGGELLDCAAGAGVYAFYFAERGFSVTATDLTPRHVRIMQEKRRGSGLPVRIAEADARDLSRFAAESFSVVLNMGPFYHLTAAEDRRRCMEESLRVLKKGGLLAVSYISRYFAFYHAALRDQCFLRNDLSDALLQTGEIHQEDPYCFWTESYYSSPEEMEQLFQEYGLSVEDHFAQDGISPYFPEKIDAFTAEQFSIWCEHHYKTCREKSILGASNHIMILGRK